MQRRRFLKLTMSAATAAALPGCRPDRGARRGVGRVLVLALDGLDPRIVEQGIRAGRLPAFARLAARGGLHRLATTTPPQTPVAFASIISGADPGTHQIYDFIHRDPGGPGGFIEPYLSFSRVEAPAHERAIDIGAWHVPLSAGRPVQLRRGPAFWEPLVGHGIDTAVYYVPANYPPSAVTGPGRFRCISGMGTPDLLGTYGAFTLYTPAAPLAGRTVGGGRFTHLAVRDHRARAALLGPANFLRRPDERGRVEPLAVPFEVVRDPTADVARIAVGGQVLLLNAGEWSAWVPITFDTGVPGSAALHRAGAATRLNGMVRFFLKRVHPLLEVYASPINIDPAAPATALSVPAGFAVDLARRHGRFYTVGIPEDTKALSHGALNEAQFLEQADLVLADLRAHYGEALRGFRRGCLFFYVGWSDLMQHMFWRDRDPDHPGRRPDEAARFAGVVDDVYRRMDELVGAALEVLSDDDTLLVLSDHGFTTFRRGFNLNTWLHRQGFLTLRDPRGRRLDLFTKADWSRTQAYGLGLNSLYLNQAGREPQGIVAERERRRLFGEISERLLAERDVDGSAVLDTVTLVEDAYPGADSTVAPDLILGYADGYRADWDTMLGGIAPEVLVDNLDRWSGTHLTAARLLPGVLLSNRPLAVADPAVTDIAPTILGAFGVPAPAAMTGRDLFAR